MEKSGISIVFILLAFFLFNSCKKEKEEIVHASSYFTSGGKKYSILSSFDQCKYANHDCLFLNSNGGIISSKSPGISMILFTENKLVLTINLYGESAGLYRKTTSMCNDFQLKSNSMIQSTDGANVAILGSDSEVEITKKSNNVISGRFKLRVNYDKDFLNDSFLVGEFNNVTLK